MVNGYNLKILTGSVNPRLGQKICDYLMVNPSGLELSRFKDGEIYARADESIRGDDVFVIQPTCLSVNDALMELLIIIDALKRASAQRITAVVPYYGYARQDRKAKSREPISAKLVADLITAAGAHRVLTIDLHADQIQGFFNIPLDNLNAMPVLAKYFKTKKIPNLTVVSPDVGGVKRARQFAQILDVPLAIIEKRRQKANQSDVMNVIGDIKGRNCILVDDMIDTGGSLVKGAEALVKKGANEVYAGIIHPVLSDPAVGRVKNSVIKELVVTNTISLAPEKKISKIKVLTIAPLIGEAIRRIHEHKSLSSLFDKWLKKGE